MKKEKTNSINIYNRKASYEYSFVEEFSTGVVLLGTEIKAIRQTGANISAAYCYIKSGEMWIKNMHISTLKNGGDNQHDPLRERKILLTKKEIRKIENELKNQGLTVVLISLYENNRGLIKLNIALAKGKKLHDKRDSIKAKDNKRDLDRSLAEK